MTDKNENVKVTIRPVRDEDRGLAQRDRDAREVYRLTRDHRAAIARYCAGNKWAMENARAVGNLPPGV